MSEQLTQHFTRAEFACRCGCGFDDVDMRLVHRLQQLRDAIGQPIHVNSGCRCEAHNKAERGQKNSFHLKGQAADIWVRKMSAAELHAAADRSKLFTGIGLYVSFIHVDIRPSRARWRG